MISWSNDQQLFGSFIALCPCANEKQTLNSVYCVQDFETELIKWAMLCVKARLLFAYRRRGGGASVRQSSWNQQAASCCACSCLISALLLQPLCESLATADTRQPNKHHRLAFIVKVCELAPFPEREVWETCTLIRRSHRNTIYFRFC